MLETVLAFIAMLAAAVIGIFIGAALGNALLGAILLVLMVGFSGVVYFLNKILEQAAK